MARNVDKLRSLLDQAGVDAILIRSKTMKGWMGTMTGSGCTVVVDQDDAMLLVDGRYVEEAREKEHDLVIELLPSQSADAIYKRLGELAGEKGWKSLGLESDETLADAYLEISRFVERPVLLGDKVARLRAVKTDEEIAKIQRAVDITDEIFSVVSSQLREGMTEYEISALLQYESVRRGAQKMAFDTICGIGERTAYPHCRPTSRALRRGDHVMMDFGIQVDNYQSDMTRICFLGEPNEKIMEIYDVVKRAQETGIAAIRTGVDSESVDAAARAVIEDAGYGAYFGHGLGHGIGVDDSTELPLLRPGRHFMLEEHMVMSCEPGVYVPGLGGVRIENDVAVIDGVGVSLNATTTDPIILEA